MQWYYSNDGAQLGPVSDDDLKAKIASGEVKPGDLAWHEGMGDWMPVSKIEELKPVQAATLESPSAVADAPVEAPATGAVTPASPYQPPGAPPSPGGPMLGGEIPTYLWQSIVVTLLCCLPFGIAAIVYASKVDSLKGTGDLAGAREASDAAKKWCLIALILGIVANVIVGVLMGLGTIQA